MYQCLNCGTEFEGNFCPECGTPRQEKKSCPNCGARVNAAAKFCNECGYPFVQTNSAQTATEAIAAQGAPKPCAAHEQAAAATGPKRTFFTEARLKQIHAALGCLPAVLFALFAVLLFAFFAAPVATVSGDGFFDDEGFESLGTVYEMCTYSEIPSLTAGMYVMIAFAELAFFLAVALALTKFCFAEIRVSIGGARPALWRVLAGCAFGFYLFFFAAGCAVTGIVRAEYFDAGACPVLLIVFSLLFALITAGSMAGRYFTEKKCPQVAEALAEERAERERKREERIAAVRAQLTPPVPPEAAVKPVRDRLLRRSQVCVRRKRRVVSAFLLFLAPYVVCLIAALCNAEFLMDFVDGGDLLTAIVLGIVLIVGLSVLFGILKKIKRFDPRRNRGITATAALSAVLFAVSLGLVILDCVLTDLLNSKEIEWSEMTTALLSVGEISLFAASYFLGIFIAALVAKAKCRRLCPDYYGAKKPNEKTTRIAEYEPLVAAYTEQKRAYRAYLAAKKAYFYDAVCYRYAIESDKRPPRFVLRAIAHRRAVFWGLAIVLLAVVLVSVFVPALTSSESLEDEFAFLVRFAEFL